MDAANMAVMPPINATVFIATGDISKRGKNLATRNTPAATIVAAWMSALTGVGPSMASGSHVCSGNWADLPMAPAEMPRTVTPPVAMLAASTTMVLRYSCLARRARSSPWRWLWPNAFRVASPWTLSRNSPPRAP